MLDRARRVCVKYVLKYLSLFIKDKNVILSTMNRTLDRVPHFDEKSLNYPIRTVIQSSILESKTWDCDVYNDR